MKLFGKNPVAQRLKSNPQSIKKIYVQEGFNEYAYVAKKARKWSLPLYTVTRSKMAKIARSLNTQGILAEVESFSYVPYEDLFPGVVKKKETLVFLDNLNDPQNFGAIIRSLACLGGFVLVIPRHHSVEVTEAVLRIASGGESFVPVTKVSNLNQAVGLAREAGYWIAGTVVEGGEDLTEKELVFPLALVIGSEHKGIRPVLKKSCDVLLSLPIKEPRLSLNVASATTIFCYEISKQKKKNI